MSAPRSPALAASVLPVLAWALLAAPPRASAAPPQVPATLSYQGVLLEPDGQPRVGSVDLTIRIFDAVAAGGLIYKQVFPAVPLVDGVFHVVLGPTGVASDPPFGTPLTTNLAEALAGDVGATGPDRFLEVTVGSDGAIGRTQVLTSAYALRAIHAATADSAAVADTATSVTEVGGVSSDFVAQLWQHFNADGGGPPNDDPLEGLADVDADGRANFIDPDNDGDGLSDNLETSQGTSVNDVTPRVLSTSPSTGFAGALGQVTVIGTSFQPGLAVEFGTQSPAPQNVTPTSFQVAVGPQPGGPVDVTVTLPNGESHTRPNAFTFLDQNVAHAIQLLSLQADLDMQPGTVELALAGYQEYGVGTIASQEEPLASNGPSGQIAVAWDGPVLTGVRCRNLSATSCVLEYLRDGDGDRSLEDETGTPIETLTSGTVTPTLAAVDLLYDASGRAMIGYVKRVAPASAMLARDLDDDGDFLGPGELVTVEANIGGGGITAAALTADAAGRLAFAYHVATAGLRVRWDRNGDGDFADTVAGNPETLTLATTLQPSCFGAAFDDDDRLALIVGETSLAETRIVRDVTADGDFSDAGESVVVPGASAAVCDVAGRPGQPLVAVTESTGVELRIDRDGDGAFDEGTERIDFPGAAGLGLVVVVGDDGHVAIARQDTLLFSNTAP